MKAHIGGILLCVVVCCTHWARISSHQAGNYPPGVPPPTGMPHQQQYQQPPQHQHNQQPPQHQQMQYQQPPPQQMQYQQPQQHQQMQYQQPPPQMMQQQQPPPQMMQQQQYQQPPQQAQSGQFQQAPPQAVQGGHQHASAHGHHPDFNQESHDKEHMQEHLKDVVQKPVDQMSDEEMEFHYFKLHDYDNNNKLDGTEITKAITHFQREGHQDPNLPVRTMSDGEISEIVDMVLKEDDLNNDGYVEYSEFVVAQRKAKANMATPDKNSAPPAAPAQH